jgi:hypothetical protein
VDFCYAVFKVDKVDTAELSVRVKIAVVWYWTDPRLVNWTGPLPATLWGPHTTLVNAQELTQEQTQFELTDPSEGRLKRGRMFYGTVFNEMDLHDFPFDLDHIDVFFESVSHYLTFDESIQGSIHVRRPTAPMSNAWLWFECTCSHRVAARQVVPDASRVSAGRGQAVCWHLLERRHPRVAAARRACIPPQPWSLRRRY